MQYGDGFTEAEKSVSMVTISAAATEVSIYVDALGVRTTSTVISCTLIDI